jgi:hypothetical protein
VAASQGSGELQSGESNFYTFAAIVWMDCAATPLPPLVSSRTPALRREPWKSITTGEKLVLVAEEAGFSVEQMIQILQTETRVEAPLCMTEWRLCPPAMEPRSSRWEQTPRSALGNPYCVLSS